VRDQLQELSDDPDSTLSITETQNLGDEEIVRVKWQLPQGPVEFHVLFSDDVEVLHGETSVRVGSIREGEDLTEELNRLKPYITK
jgi:hypothetical protein